MVARSTQEFRLVSRWWRRPLKQKLFVRARCPHEEIVSWTLGKVNQEVVVGGVMEDKRKSHPGDWAFMEMGQSFFTPATEGAERVLAMSPSVSSPGGEGIVAEDM